MTTLLLDINGTKVSITGDNLSVAIDEKPTIISDQVKAEVPPEMNRSARDFHDDLVSRQAELTRRGIFPIPKAKAGGDPLAPKPFSLRPHCRKPGADDCGGYGSSHCHTCTEAMKGAAA